MESDIKTRVTPVREVKTSGQEGNECLVIIYSSDARIFGKRHVLGDGPILLGRGSENTIVLENDSVSRRHARVERRSGNWYVMDLESTNGTYVNDKIIVNEYQLRRGDQVKVGDSILKFLGGSDVESQYYETIYRMTIMDGLTAVHNKRYLMEALEKEIPRARRHERPLSLLMFDIDHFKNVNDTFGHLAGDYVLKELATVVKSRLRPDDVLGRYGGEEFGVLLPETPLLGSAKIAEELRTLIEAHPFTFEQEKMKVTISVGCAQLLEGWDVLAFIKRADEQLYAAKRGGRNRVAASET